MKNKKSGLSYFTKEPKNPLIVIQECTPTNKEPSDIDFYQSNEKEKEINKVEVGEKVKEISKFEESKIPISNNKI